MTDAPLAGRSTSSGTLTVALMEDDMVLCLCMETLFEDWGMQLVSAPTPAALLDALNGGAPPDILVADYHLGRHGKAPESVRTVLADLGPALPVIITTGDESAATQAEIRDAGWYFLPKPYDPESLRALILTVLERAD
ncbi:response regulator receiver domain-containing protein [Azospirillum brasilense]|uniref:Response regulator receiver domain-containing protein n=1 Tax=Azospirillum brasilense TaxID=192 RepID=A0A560C900_AZOBR|nr:response regulator [Azospirillum brasilense]MBK3733601.1 response regulator [Azospirillum brasilense]TWA81334.1 response regulator receiver domain-containing protein [Azospirillum brasilense]